MTETSRASAGDPPPHDPSTAAVVLEVAGLQIATRQTGQRLVDGVSFRLRRGETVAIVGESGSGKTITSRAILGLLPGALQVVGGSVRLRGEELLTMNQRQLAEVRGRRIASVFQEPSTALNPVMKIGRQVREPLLRHHLADRGQAGERVVQLLREVGLPDPAQQYSRYPHELSGGMKQRVAIAIALACEPGILIADEPTTALDVTTQAQILRLVQHLTSTRDTAVLWITHDLGVVAGLADRVVVMRGGVVLEEGPTAEVLAAPAHPYTQGLLDSIPRLHGPSPRRLATTVPSASPGPTEPR